MCTDSRALRHVLRIWGEGFKESDLVKEAEKERVNPVSKCVNNGKLFQTPFGLSVSQLRDVDDIVVPADLSITDNMQRKGSIPYNNIWLKCLLANATGRRTPFGTTMTEQQVITLIRDIPNEPITFPKPELQYHHSKDVLVSHQEWAVPTLQGYRFKAGDILKDKRALWVAVAAKDAKKQVHEILSTGWNPQTMSDLVPTWFQDHNLPEDEVKAWDTEVETLWHMGSITQVTQESVRLHGLPQVVLPIFLVKEKDKFRPIMDARYSNVPFLPPWFSLPKIQNFLSKLTKDIFWFKSDIKGGWHHIPIAQDHSNFFAFHWKGKLFQYKVCPFGDATAPYCFTYLMISLKKLLKTRGVKDFILYIDDLLVPASLSWEESCLLREKVIKTQLSLNVALGAKKCPPPSKRGEALGFLVDTQLGMVTFTDEKFEVILKLAEEIKEAWTKGAKIHVRKLASLLGKVVSGILLCPFTIGLLHDCIIAITELTTDNRWDQYIVQSPKILQGVFQWIYWSKANPKRLWCNPAPVIWCSSDATLTSASAVFWGFTPEFTPSTCKAYPLCQAKTESVPSHTNIAVIEAFAIYWGLHTLWNKIVKWLASRNLQPNTVEWVWATDNQVCQGSFNKGRSFQKEVHMMAQNTIKQFVLKYNLKISFPYIPSKINMTADNLTRLVKDKNDWRLAKAYLIKFLKFCKKKQLPTPTVDAFATRENRLFEDYCSEFWDLGSRGSFYETDLNKECVWCNPPFGEIHRTLEHVTSHKLTAWVVVPTWPGEPWWHLTMDAHAYFNLQFAKEYGPLNSVHLPDRTIILPWALNIFLFRS